MYSLYWNIKINWYRRGNKNKDNYVIKSLVGRYSQEVYIGKFYTQEKWNEQIKIVSKRKKYIYGRT